MRQHSDELESVLEGSFERDLSVNVFHGSDRVLEDVRFESWQLDSGLGSTVSTSGSGTVVYGSVDGESLSPSGTDGVLSPFRARVELVMTVRAGSFSESVSLGTFRVVSVPEASDVFADRGDGWGIVTASRVRIEFLSLDEDTARWGFIGPEQSLAGVSAFGEIRRLTGMPVEESIADVNVPSLKVWEAKQGGRLDAVIELGKVLGGTAVVNSRGAWEVIPDAVGDPVAVLKLGSQGTVTEIGDEIDTDTVYNEVVGRFEDVKGNAFYSIARVTSGSLAVDGLYGRHTRYYESDLVNTPTQGQAAVDAVLAQSIGSQQYDIQVQCHMNPIVEVGDVVQLDGWKRPVIGRLTDVKLTDGAYMNVTIRASRELA